MEYVIQDREPIELYHFFEELSAIPRVSRHEAAAADYVVAVAKKCGLWYYEDDLHNVLVRKPGSRGCEDQKPVLLEGHLDMVGKKTAESRHDFSKDPIRLIEEGNLLYADGTTLGADNGCAVAIMLKILTDPDTFLHPPVECLFTVQEEIGLVGAKAFDHTMIQSRRAIGLDAGSEGVFRKGTSTKIQMTAGFACRREPVSGTVYQLMISGLRGGDQGSGIPLERICAIKMTARVLHQLNQEMDVRVISMEHLGKSIPEECTSYIALVDGGEDQLKESLFKLQAQIRKQYQESDPDIQIELRRAKAAQMLVKEDSDQLINALYLLPYGGRNRALTRIDEVSCSVVTKKIYTDEKGIHIFTVISTELMEHGEALDEEMQTFVKCFGFQIEEHEIRSGWQPEEYSPIREAMICTYRNLFHKDPKVNISHGGNDCEVLKRKIPDLDVVTTAATYVDFHTPKEKLYMDTFEKVSKLVEQTLDYLAKEEK